MSPADFVLNTGTGVYENGDGNGTLDQSAASGTIVADGGAGDDTITTGSGDDSVRGGSGDDTINTGDGNDQIFMVGDTAANAYTTTQLNTAFTGSPQQALIHTSGANGNSSDASAGDVINGARAPIRSIPLARLI